MTGLSSTMVIAVPFVVEGWHAPAGRRTREPRPLAQAGQIRPAAPVGARNWDPAGKPVAGQPQRRRPDRRSGRVPGSDATPVRSCWLIHDTRAGVLGSRLDARDN